MTYEADFAQHIVSRIATVPGPGQVPGPVDLTYGSNCREGEERPPSSNQSIPGAVPPVCIFVVETGGFADTPFIAGRDAVAEPSDWPGEFPIELQALVRSPVNNYDIGKALADAVLKAVDKSIPAGFFEVRAINPTPLRLGKDETDHYRWTINFTAKRCQ